MLIHPSENALRKPHPPGAAAEDAVEAEAVVEAVVVVEAAEQHRNALSESFARSNATGSMMRRNPRRKERDS